MIDTIPAPAAIAASPKPPEPIPPVAAPVVETPPAAEPKGMSARITKKIEDLRNPKPAAPAESAKPVAAVTPAPAPTKAPEPDSDEALNKEIAETTKNWKDDGGQKKAFTEKTYLVRDLKRQTKDLAKKAEAADALQKELEALRASPAAATQDTQNQIETLSKRAEAAEAAVKAKEDELAVTAVERSDAWKAAIAKPLSALEARAKELAKKYELNEWTVLTALHGSSDQQDEVAGAMKDADKIKFLADAAKITDINEKAEVLRANAVEALEKMALMQAATKEEQAKAQTKSHSEAYATAHQENWKAMQASVPVLNAVEGDDEVSKNWNQHIADSEKFAREAVLSKLDVPTQSKLVQRGTVYPLLVGAIDGYKKQLEAKHTELSEALERLSKFEKSKPGAQVSVNDGVTAPVVVPKPGDAAKRIASALFAK